MNETQYVRWITDYNELNILCWHRTRIINEIKPILYYVNCKLLNVKKNYPGEYTLPTILRAAVG